MLLRIVVFFVCVTLMSPVLAQSDDAALFEFLSIPSPMCGVVWNYSSEYFDSSRANPDFSVRQLQGDFENARIKGDSLLTYRILLELAPIYESKDSAYIANRYRSQAQAGLKTLYKQHPSAEIAFLIGKTCDISDSACAWYEEAIRWDSTYYRAYFLIVSKLDNFTSKEKLSLWTHKTTKLAERLIAESTDDVKNAEIFYELADMQAGVGFVDTIFNVFANALSHADELDDTSKTNELFRGWMRSMFGSMCDPKRIALLERASELNPRNTGYKLNYLAAELGRIFLSTFAAANLNDSDEDMRVFMNTHWDKNRQQIQSILSRLEEIDRATCIRYPCVYYYRALAKYMLQDMKGAHWDILEYMNNSPEDPTGYAVHCGIINELAQQFPDDAGQYIGEILEINRQKCEQESTAPECYRIGTFMLLSGDPGSAVQYFESATQQDGSDVSSKIALAVCSYLVGDVEKTNRLLQAIQKDAKDLSGESLACYALLRSVMNGRNGDIDNALYWAQQAVDAESRLQEPKALLSLLQTIK